MNKLKALTEDKYTLNDIFVKNYEIWLIIPAFCYIIAQAVHILIYTFLYREPVTSEELAKYFSKAEYPGDYFIAILQGAILFAAIFAVVAIISAVISVKKRVRKIYFADNIAFILFSLYCVIAVVSTALNHIDMMQIKGLDWDEGFINYLSYFLVFYFCCSLIRKEEYKYYIIYSIISVGMIVGILCLVNDYIVDIPIISDYWMCGIYYNINFYAYFLTILILMSAYLAIKDPKKSRRVFAFAMLCMNTVILSINNTLGGFVACLAGFIFMTVAVSIKNRKFSWISLLIFGVFLAITFASGFFVDSFFTQFIGLFADVKMIVTDDENALSAGTDRWRLWTNTFTYIRERPWIGNGYTGIESRLLEDAGNGKVHNEYLENTAYYGIPAILLYISGLGTIYIKALVKKEKVDNATLCCLIGAFAYAVSAFFGNSRIFIAPFFYIVLGLANSTCKDEKVEMPEIVTEDNISEAEENVDCSVEDIPMVTETE